MHVDSVMQEDSFMEKVRMSQVLHQDLVSRTCEPRLLRESRWPIHDPTIFCVDRNGKSGSDNEDHGLMQMIVFCNCHKSVDR
jgi:hypothetical protein